MKLSNYIYYETENGTLYKNNNLEILPLLEQKFKLCFTSPPYNIGNRRSDFFSTGYSKNKKNVYDIVDDNLPQEEYIELQHKTIKLIYNLLSGDGALFYNHKPRIINKKFDNRHNLIPFPIRQEIIWKTNTFINFGGHFFVPNTERIYIIAKDNWKPNKNYLGLGEVWEIPQDRFNPHPAPFSMALAMQVILSATNKGDTVLDVYCGSGTTCLACERLGRKYVGIDVSEKYLEMAKQRIRQETSQLKLF
jgi:modification methylase